MVESKARICPAPRTVAAFPSGPARNRKPAGRQRRDAHDRGGIVPEITRDGKTKSFRPDHDEGALPATLVPYTQQTTRVKAAPK